MFYDCIKLLVVRDGSAIFRGNFGQRPINVGDAVLLGADVLCAYAPEGVFRSTTIYVDADYLMDQVRWQYAGLVRDRFEAIELSEAMYPEVAQVLRLGEQVADELSPWLDELVILSNEGGFRRHHNRMQALWFLIIGAVSPFVRAEPVQIPEPSRSHTRPATPRNRPLVPIRPEARQAAHLLRSEPQRRWTLEQLAAEVHLSVAQLSRVFVEAYGHTPLAYLTTVRTERLAKLLRQSSVPIDTAMHAVGWHSRSHGAELFRQATGMSPREYRRCRQIDRSA